MNSLSRIEYSIVTVALLCSYQLASWFLARRRRARITTPLRGPPPAHPIWGSSGEILKSDRAAEVYEAWAQEHGSVFSMSTPFFGREIILADPQAVTHFYAKGTTVYVQSKLNKIMFDNMLGKGLLSADGADHKRQRKTLAPAFSVAALRGLTGVFCYSVYKAKAQWDAMLDGSSGQPSIDVQEWMNHISLDSLGIAGFGHDFGSLDNKSSPVLDMFESFNHNKTSIFDDIVFLLVMVFPRVFSRVPTARNEGFWKFKKTVSQTAADLVESTKRESKVLGEQSVAEKSLIGSLIKAESAQGSLSLSSEEVNSQMNLLLLAGYETVGATLTWTLIELCKHKDTQDRLRKELLKSTSATDPTYDDLTNGLPYLDAVCHETLRLHAPLQQTTRIAAEDDIIPLSRPYTTASDEVVDRITVAKGSSVTVSAEMINRSKDFWGPDAKDFRAERWLEMSNHANDKGSLKAHELQGHQHLLTFLDGPRICLGRNFALIEIKAVLCVLVKNFTFELPNGPDTEIVLHQTMLKRPKVAGEAGPRVPLLVRRIGH